MFREFSKIMCGTHRVYLESMPWSSDDRFHLRSDKTMSFRLSGPVASRRDAPP